MKNKSNPHHLVLGKLTDFLTGSILEDTLDERYRQKIGRKLVVNCGFEKTDILNNITIEVEAGNRKAAMKIDFLIKYHGKIIIIIKYAPGSLVTRRLTTLGLSRIVRSYQVPIAIITNGKDAEIIDGISGKIIATELKNLPDKKYIQKNSPSFVFKTIKKKIFEQASRIVYACEVDDACPCDSDICIIE